MALLEVTDLKVHFQTDDGIVKAVDGVSYTVERGQALGIVGESGSGKSVSSLTVMGLTRFAGNARDLGLDHASTARTCSSASDEDLRRLRGNEIAMIFQDPLSSLHPFYKIGDQLVEAVQAHRDVSKAQALDRAVEMLGLVGIPEPRRRVDAYPHEFSGGMRQRVMIAMALINDPKLLIADEPTTALDVTVQAQILELIQRLQRELDTAIVMITHDLGVVAEVADEIARDVRRADRRARRQGHDLRDARAPLHLGAAQVDPAPGLAARRGARADPGPPAVAHPQAAGLLASIRAARTCARPTSASTRSCAGRRAARRGQARGRLPAAAADAPRAVGAQLQPAAPRRERGRARRVPASPRRRAVDRARRCRRERRPTLIEVRDLVKHFPLRQGIILQKQVGAVRAVDGITFDVFEGETLGLVGESGCGKSTTARLITRLLEPTSGEIIYKGNDIAHLVARASSSRCAATCR